MVGSLCSREIRIDMKTPTTLIVLDGFGLNDKTEGNAVKAAKTPVLDRLLSENAHTALSASGSDVGLPEGQMGNSEVGHTNIGSGRVVFQDLPRISKAIEDGDFFENKAYNAAMDACLEQGTALHLLGTAQRRRRPFPYHTPVRPAGAGKAQRPYQSLCTCISRRARRAPRLRHSVCATAADRCAASGRRQNRHGSGPVLRHGPRQALGSCRGRL